LHNFQKEKIRMKHSIRSYIAIGSAVCIWIAAIIQALQLFDLTGGEQPNFRGDGYSTLIQSLDVPTLTAFWAWKSSQLGIDVTIDLFAALGSAGLAYCVIILRRVFKRYQGGNSDLPAFMSGCFFIGAILPSFEFLQSLGYTTSADSISQWKTIPSEGLQALYIAYTIGRGSTFYIFSAQFVFVSVGLTLVSILSLRTNELPRKHAILGFITCFFGYLTFVFEIVVFNVGGRGLSITVGIIFLLYGVILLPIWTIWLGVELRRLKQDQRDIRMSNLDEHLNNVQMDSVSK